MYLSTPRYLSITRRVMVTNMILPLIWSQAFFETWAKVYRAVPSTPVENHNG